MKATLDMQKHTQARAKKYYREYETTIQGRLQKKQHRMEQVCALVCPINHLSLCISPYQIYKNAFEECLKLQRERVRDMQWYSRERRSAMAQKYEDELLSLENL